MTCTRLELAPGVSAIACTRGRGRITSADREQIALFVEQLRLEPVLVVLPPVWPARVGCWRVIEHRTDAFRRGWYVDLAGRTQDHEDALDRLRERVAATGRPWRLYWICAAGTWSPYGVVYPMGPALLPGRAVDRGVHG